MEQERLIKTRYRVIMSARCPDCGAPVPTMFEHLDRECSTEDPRDPCVREVMWPREPGYDRLKQLVEPFLGGHLEHVTVLADFDNGRNFNRADMFVHDSGQKLRLPRNEDATTIYRRATLCGRSAAPIPNDPEELPFIFGPAVLFDRRVWF